MMVDKSIFINLPGTGAWIKRKQSSNEQLPRFLNMNLYAILKKKKNVHIAVLTISIDKTRFNG
jgi:hypothetical protein